MKLNRLENLIGSFSLNKLENATILVIGVGGVGGYVVEALVRNGIGNIILVDYDKVDITNFNRQIIALDDNIGKYKVINYQLKQDYIDVLYKNKATPFAPIEDLYEKTHSWYEY